MITEQGRITLNVPQERPGRGFDIQKESQSNKSHGEQNHNVQKVTRVTFLPDPPVKDLQGGKFRRDV